VTSGTSTFRDLNHNGAMEPYEDPRLPVAERVTDLVGRMTLEEKAGQMVQNSIAAGPDGELREDGGGASVLNARERIVDNHITHMNVHYLPAPALAARWANRMQELAAGTRLGIPVSLSSDPRHGFREHQGVSFASSAFSQWPEQIGLAAIRDPDLVERYGDIVRREYRAVGLTGALHPTIDLATEPRWARQMGTFGQDAGLTSELVRAYLRGLQGETLGRSGVAAMTKHFPGGGPQRDGEDPHFPYGSDQVYPGGAFETHLEPFRAAIAAGTSAIMPYYGKPVGLVRHGEAIEEVGFGFNRQVITGMLREELGFDGVVCTDWGLVSDLIVPAGVLGPTEKRLPARAWGAEHLSAEDRVAKILDAGADQLGGEDIPDVIVSLARSGRIPEERIDRSVARLLGVKFQLGLFDDPFVSEADAEHVVGADELVAEGLAAQRRSITVLTALGGLPTEDATRVFVDGVDSDVATQYAEVVSSPQDADLAIVRLDAPAEHRDDLFLEASFRAGSLEFSTDVVDRVRKISESAPTVVDVFLDRPAVLAPLLEVADALTTSYGSSDRALLDVILGDAAPEGRLPFDIPASMAAVERSSPDLPGDTPDATFRFGHGLGALRAR
jgi:beta-glucosidase